ncbi:hypothetical protein QTP88_000994 [Uroleucon formosanum]
MCKAGEVLDTFYPRIIHLTCLVHGFHRISETIRFQFSEVDSLISNVKKIFLKAPSRIQTFKDMYPDLTLPPEPIITRWGTWLSAVLYYSNNFEKIRNVVLNLDPEAAMAIKKTVELIDSKNLQNNLAFISTNFGFLVDTISKLETSKMPLTERLEIVDNAIKQLERVPGEIGVLTNSKLKNVLEKNTGFNTEKFGAETRDLHIHRINTTKISTRIIQGKSDQLLKNNSKTSAVDQRVSEVSTSI